MLCTVSSVNASHGPTPEQKMFRGRTEAMLFRTGTVPVPVPVPSLMCDIIKGTPVGATATCCTADAARHGNEGSVKRLGSASHPPRHVSQEESS